MLSVFYAFIISFIAIAPTTPKGFITDAFMGNSNSTTSSRMLHFIVGGSVGLFLVLLILSAMAVTASIVLVILKRRKSGKNGQYYEHGTVVASPSH